MVLDNGFFSTENIGREFFETDPLGRRAAFFSGVQNRNQSPAFETFVRGQFDNIFDDFLESVGTRIRAGQPLDDLTFADFVPQQDLGAKFRATPPSLRPFGSTARFAPRTRTLFNF